jgi:diacylglycerol kinase family enzyme
VCVSAGTRNHFAFDLGIDRNDVVAALDAFDDGIERRIDLGRVNGRVFVNNVAMGVYGAVVESPAYRDHKMRTVIDMLSQLVGPGAERFDLRFAGRDGTTHDSALLILVSNNPYTFDPRPQVRTRGTLDDGVLGVITVARPPPQRPEEWSTPRFRVDSATTVAVGIDGESVALSPPLLFESDRRALRVRLPAPRQRRRPRPARTLRGPKDPPAQPSHRS